MRFRLVSSYRCGQGGYYFVFIFSVVMRYQMNNVRGADDKFEVRTVIIRAVELTR